MPLILLTGQGAAKSLRAPGSQQQWSGSTASPPAESSALCARRNRHWACASSLPSPTSPGSVSAPTDPGERGHNRPRPARRRRGGTSSRTDQAVGAGLLLRQTNASVGYFISTWTRPHPLTAHRPVGAGHLTGSAAARRLLPGAPLRWWRCACSRSIPTPEHAGRRVGLIPAEPTTANTLSWRFPRWRGRRSSRARGARARRPPDCRAAATPGRATYGGARPHRRRVEGLMDIAPSTLSPAACCSMRSLLWRPPRQLISRRRPGLPPHRRYRPERAANDHRCRHRDQHKGSRWGPEIGGVLHPRASHPAPTQGTGSAAATWAADLMVAPHQAGTTKALGSSCPADPAREADRPHRSWPGACPRR